MHLSSTTIAGKALTLLSVAGGVEAFWRMPCKGRTGLARIDPLVNYGVAADHVHAIHGSNGFSTTATSDDLLAGDCTSCEVTQDMSAYWHPALYFKKASGEFQVVQQVGGMLAYYLLEPEDAKLTAFPKGFEMLAGDTNQRNFTYPVPDIEKSLWKGEYVQQPFLRQWALGFNCLNYNAQPEAALYRHFLPDKSYLDQHCTEGVRLELMFPSCWDGVNLDGINHDKRSHVAYPSLGNTGACPEGFPVRLASLFYESIWNTYEFKGQDGQFVFANGDPTGYGYHADFITGWDEDFLQSAIDTCKNRSGRIEDCPLFTLQSESKMNECQIPTAKNNILASVFQEKVSNKLDVLPGNVQIKAGPAYAKGAAPVKSNAPIPSAVVPTLEHSDAPTADASKAYLPGAVLQETVKEEPKPTTTPSAAPTPIIANKVAEQPVVPATTAPPVSSAPLANTQSYISTEYITKGREVVHVLWVEELITVTGTVTTTTTILSAGPEKKRHLHRHRRGVERKMH